MEKLYTLHGNKYPTESLFNVIWDFNNALFISFDGAEIGTVQWVK